ncbi:aminotransferase class III [Candidatus Beckwithbacteria bacterium CG10_big_fil_rev_8_21_14_0_10_34_10]|uniref:Aminotransferase class III n=1 Tax=Candidatus Beckwithbacteria bacterium CG10_big_fil_rev_8_21_14_0_10_34_10 TaxID=1974495 RepID=A0A2H0W975_9BACT|nr:MAG: aminotransferase class III [Candidatus Beckwithbacteria bacterium CG10_big_fil_rev_8_21_14_0_10_34_10]
MGKSQDLYKEAKKLIPGGTQLLSKRPEMFLPDLWPAYYSKAKGCEVWDLDDKKYIDMGQMSVGACILGYADSDVDRAVKNAVDKGNISILNAPEEVELAKLLIKIHPWAQMVRYTRTGGEAVAVAIRIARARTKKDVILFCGYHGWHDWYLSSNLADKKALDGHLLPGLNPLGVPRVLKRTSYPFKFNKTKQFLWLIKKHRDKIGAVIMEPLRHNQPEREFIDTIVEITKKLGIVLIIDEVSMGFRLNEGGAHLQLEMEPDIAVFAKAISNGYSMGVIIGKRKIMQIAQDTFISSTSWTERIGLVASLATIRKSKCYHVYSYLQNIGGQIKKGWQSTAQKHGLKINVSGTNAIGHFSFKHKKQLVLKTIFTQLMLEKGFLASTSFYASYAHKKKHVKKYLEALDEVFAFIAKAVKEGNPEKHLKGSVCHAGFKRLA